MVPFWPAFPILPPGQTIADPFGVMSMSSRHWYGIRPGSVVAASITAGRLAASRSPPPLPTSSSRTVSVWWIDQLNASVRWLAAQDSDLAAKRPPMVPLPVADQDRATPLWTEYSLTCWMPAPGATAIASLVPSGDRAMSVIVFTSATDMGSRVGAPGRPEALSRTW